MAGHDAGVVLRFYFPMEEAVTSVDLHKAIFYGGEYNFHDANKKAAFDDLKQKLTTVYGSPSAEFTDPEEFWGKPVYLRGDMSMEDADRTYHEDLENYEDLSYAVWQQSGTDKQIILVYSRNQGAWEDTSLYYFDTSADALIGQLYHQASQGTEEAFSDSLNGL